MNTDRINSGMKYLNDLLQKFELSQYSGEIEPLTLKSIRIVTQSEKEKDLPIGISKFGGCPDLPPNFEWPRYKDRPLSFLAQFRLEELAYYDTGNFLPSTGLLYFFYDPEQEPWGFDPAWKGGWKVIYESEISNLARRLPPAYVSTIFDLDYKPCLISFSEEITLPSWESEEIQQLPLTEEERENYFELVNGGVIHRVFGHPTTIQGEMEAECQLVSNGIYMGNRVDYNNPKVQELLKTANEWQLLLQLDSDENPGFRWGEEGRLYYWIQRTALKSLDFSNVWLVGQCT